MFILWLLMRIAFAKYFGHVVFIGSGDTLESALDKVCHGGRAIIQLTRASIDKVYAPILAHEIPNSIHRGPKSPKTHPCAR